MKSQYRNRLALVFTIVLDNEQQDRLLFLFELKKKIFSMVSNSTLYFIFLSAIFLYGMALSIVHYVYIHPNTFKFHKNNIDIEMKFLFIFNSFYFKYFSSNNS